MKPLALIAMTFALLCASSIAAVRHLHDRELFVPPPESIAEGFIRAVVEGRYQPASELLEDQTIGEADLRALDKSLQAKLGEPTTIDAKTTAQSDEDATAEVTLESARGCDKLPLTLHWSGSGWKVRLRNGTVPIEDEPHCAPQSLLEEGLRDFVRNPRIIARVSSRRSAA